MDGHENVLKAKHELQVNVRGSKTSLLKLNVMVSLLWEVLITAYLPSIVCRYSIRTIKQATKITQSNVVTVILYLQAYADDVDNEM